MAISYMSTHSASSSKLLMTRSSTTPYYLDYIALETNVKELRVFSNSQLVVEHINGDYKAHNIIMIKYLAEHLAEWLLASKGSHRLRRGNGGAVRVKEG
ncbi:hypothetical protein GW17_00010596 [Ensete ventricosum]|nr:hypothetical protein GW17_00010596 [Ensete ventricosum]